MFISLFKLTFIVYHESENLTNPARLYDFQKKEATWPPRIDHQFNLPAILECLESRAHLLDSSRAVQYQSMGRY